MPSYEDLDAFKACHQLTLAVYRTTKKIEDFDTEMAGELWSAALIASSRIARGSAVRSRRLFAACIDRTLGALAEISYLLNMAFTLELISADERQELESLGGRAQFYAMKLLLSLGADPGAGKGD